MNGRRRERTGNEVTPPHGTLPNPAAMLLHNAAQSRRGLSMRIP
jgi:hypothetical protein